MYAHKQICTNINQLRKQQIYNKTILYTNIYIHIYICIFIYIYIWWWANNADQEMILGTDTDILGELAQAWAQLLAHHHV